ncbi:syntaxin 1B/2/3 [Trypanosoma grayi]|uniref:syntaxin 1B/2/3 n=1 Tax=Trypanosoma grayi TaxID=71804 RepID=UPI0004F48C99|nr:syntaxin 1B/2/3 [Trypanosoma grayi]KEG11087.1 syntaxin 1B/2/3 [Trypanosoma grayi]
MDRTEALRELFDKSSPYVSDCENFVVLGILREHPFNRAFAAVSTAADVAVRATRSRIKAALRAMEECSPAVSELESILLLHEAELLSASNTIKDLLASLMEAKEQLKKQHSRWDGLFLFAKEETQSPTTAKPSLQLLQHLEAALETLEGTVGRWRLRLALCKEELALYKQEMFAFGRAGVLSCSDPAKTQEGGKDRHLSRDNNISQSVSCLRNSEERPRSAVAVVSVVDRVLKKAARTVTAAPLHSGAHVWSLMRGHGETGLRDLASPDRAAPQFVYTAAEEERLAQTNAALLEQQKQASAEDAKAVEASVRELSQLTSLMNERVLQQNEQFSILLKNTEAAQSNMQKGVGEVGKSLTYFWNSTRQLIACLWLSTLVLLIANWVIR